MDEELIDVFEPRKQHERILVCKCLRDDESIEKVEISARKQKILTTVSRTELYLRSHRISELTHFLFTKILAQQSDKPILYLEKLLDDCMLFRAGHGPAPVIFQNRHLEAVVKSFDPGQRGWLSAGQIRRAYVTLGLNLDKPVEEKVPCDVVLNNLKKAQDTELLSLLSAGTEVDDSIKSSKSSTVNT